MVITRGIYTVAFNLYHKCIEEDNYKYAPNEYLCSSSFYFWGGFDML